MVLLVGCGAEEIPASIVPIQPQPIESQTKDTSEDKASEETKVTESTEGVKVADEPTITKREVVDGKMQSYLTGEWKAEEVVKRRSMAVMMPNNKPAMPQYGITRASIVYEAPVEGRVT
ncbi:MAG: DUF3048 domain-containing protein, partial [Lachnospiraceae bacterium]|nr:DUF3048 domain-containing protein [Lachnospiraceae bacterium]